MPDKRLEKMVTVVQENVAQTIRDSLYWNKQY